MSLIDIPPLLYPTPLPINTSELSFGNAQANAATEKVGTVFNIPKAGTIERVVFTTGSSLTLDGASVIRVSLQDATIDVLDLEPDGTQDQYRDMDNTLITAADTAFESGIISSDGTDGGVKRTVSAGDQVAVVFEFQNFVTSDDFTIKRFAWNGIPGWNDIPTSGYTLTATGSTWTDDTTISILIGLKYDDGTYVHLGSQMLPGVEAAVKETAIQGNKETGLRFQVPFPCRIVGAAARVESGADCEMVLYDAGETLLATSTLVNEATTSRDAFRVFLDTPTVLTKDTNYFLVVHGTEASNEVALQGVDVVDTNWMQANGGGSNFVWATRADRTTDSFSITTTRQPFICLILDQIDDGSSGSGGLVGGSQLNRGLN